MLVAGADPGFLERGFICIEVCVGRYIDFMSFFLKYYQIISFS